MEAHRKHEYDLLAGKIVYIVIVTMTMTFVNFRFKRSRGQINAPMFLA